MHCEQLPTDTSPSIHVCIVPHHCWGGVSAWAPAHMHAAAVPNAMRPNQPAPDLLHVCPPQTLLELQHYSQNLQRRAMQAGEGGPAGLTSAAGLPAGLSSMSAAGLGGGGPESLMDVDWGQRLAQANARLARLMQPKGTSAGAALHP